MVASSTKSDTEIGQSPLSPSGCDVRVAASLLLLLSRWPDHPVVVPRISGPLTPTDGMLFVGQDTSSPWQKTDRPCCRRRGSG